MINFEFIQELEGNASKGYVPDPEHSRSGVTIGAGFDLGARSKTELYQAFSTALADKLAPYATLTMNHAVNALKQKPLTLSLTEVAAVNRYAKQQAVDRLQEQWNNDPETKENFAALPSVCQTVIASVAFQYGCLSQRTPNFWRQVTTGDWHGALANLRDFGDRYPTRRNKEADMLQALLDQSS